jgi:hypothetical protein
MGQMMDRVRLPVRHRLRHAIGFACLAGLLLFVCESTAQAQAVSGIRGLSGGVGALFSYFGPGNLYVDNQGIQGYVYNFTLFETYSFRSAGGQAWSGGIMTLGPQQTIGLIQGANQSGSSPLVFPSAPRQVPPLPPIDSSLLDEIP